MTGEAPSGGWAADGGPSITVGKHPRRKSYCLFVADGSTIDTVAYFRNEESAQTFLDALGVLVRGRPA